MNTAPVNITAFSFAACESEAVIQLCLISGLHFFFFFFFLSDCIVVLYII